MLTVVGETVYRLPITRSLVSRYWGFFTSIKIPLGIVYHIM